MSILCKILYTLLLIIFFGCDRGKPSKVFTNKYYRNGKAIIKVETHSKVGGCVFIKEEYFDDDGNHVLNREGYFTVQHTFYISSESTSAVTILEDDSPDFVVEKLDSLSDAINKERRYLINDPRYLADWSNYHYYVEKSRNDKETYAWFYGCDFASLKDNIKPSKK